MAIPPDLASKIEISEIYGRAIYYQDQAAALGTDVLHHHLGTSAEKGLGGYLTLRDAAAGADGNAIPLPSWSVLFYTLGESPAVKYRVHVTYAARRRSSQ